MTPLDVLRRGVASYEPFLQPSGELFDPFFGEPTQYGTPYHAFCQSVSASAGEGDAALGAVDRASKGLRASLRHLNNLTEQAPASGFDRTTGSVARVNHRDFFWPPVVWSFRLLRALGATDATVAEAVAAVDVERAFSSRPPSNWAAVWLLGEWMRMGCGLSPLTQDDIDGLLEPFFAERILLDLGLYQEPGHPNSYDLFARYHLASLLAEGYAGRWREPLEQLMESGTRRSLDVQLSDGSLASAHRSTGQTWTLGAECAYFTLAARYFDRRDPALAARAREAAGLALVALMRWQRPDGPYSPAENLLPPAARVGYEAYTADAHYGSLALAFLGAAILRGLAGPVGAPVAGTTPRCRIEVDPTWRAIAHRGPYSIHATARPSPTYDAYGVLDITFGPGRLFQLVSSVRSLVDGKLYGPGLARREGNGGLGPLAVLAHTDPLPLGPITATGPAGFVIDARPRGAPFRHRLACDAGPDGIRISESTPGLEDCKTLLFPYLRDAGAGFQTKLETRPGEVRFHHGPETVSLHINGEVERLLDLPHHCENRRGRCGLLRIDLRGPRTGIEYTLTTLR